MKKSLCTLAMLAVCSVGMAQTDLGDITIDAQLRSRGSSEKSRKMYPFLPSCSVLTLNTAAGLNDLNANVALKASKKVDMSLAYHYFAAPKLDEDKTLGSEIDFQLNWKIQKNVTFQCGYSILAATNSLCTLKGHGDAGAWNDWGWVSLNVNPTIFSTKK